MRKLENSPKLKPVLMTATPKLIEKLDQIIDKQGHTSRSEAMRNAVSIYHRYLFPQEYGNVLMDVSWDQLKDIQDEKSQ